MLRVVLEYMVGVNVRYVAWCATLHQVVHSMQRKGVAVQVNPDRPNGLRHEIDMLATKWGYNGLGKSEHVRNVTVE